MHYLKNGYIININYNRAIINFRKICKIFIIITYCNFNWIKIKLNIYITIAYYYLLDKIFCNFLIGLKNCRFYVL